MVYSVVDRKEGFPMLRVKQWSLPVLLSVAFSAVAAGAEQNNPGQDDLDKATQLKLSAQTGEDLQEVIRLCESAQKKGLDKDSDAFARDTILASLVQRGLAGAKALLTSQLTVADWPRVRPQRDKYLEDLEKAVKMDPKQAEALFFIARLNLLPNGDPKRLAEALDQAIEAAGDDRPLLAKALGFRADISKDPKKKQADLDRAVELAPQEASVLFARALLLADQGESQQALDDLRKVVELEPRSPAALQALALVLAKLKKYDEAMIALDKLREIDPNSVFPYVQQARIHVLQANFQAALHDLDQAVSHDSSNVEVLLLRAEMLHELKQKDKARADVESVLAIRPGHPGAIRMRAVFLATEGKVDQAILQLEDLRAKGAKDPTTLNTLAMLYAMGKHNRPAIEAFTALLAQQPNNAAALRNRGDLYLGIGKHAEAVADFNEAVKLEPKEPGLLNNLAWVLATSPVDSLRDGKRAVELATKACEETEYKKAYILSTLAAAYAETGDMKKAVEWSEKSLAVGSDEHKESLQKELASYRAGKPWRETLTEGESPKLESGKSEKKPTPSDAKPDPDQPAKPVAKAAESNPEKPVKAKKSKKK
jgi:tetratricopeptide (TPR) repeat protein